VVWLRNLHLTYAADLASYGFDITGEDGDDKANEAKWKRCTSAWKETLKPVAVQYFQITQDRREEGTHETDCN
jgi:hypothetical protein